VTVFLQVESVPQQTIVDAAYYTHWVSAVSAQTGYPLGLGLTSKFNTDDKSVVKFATNLKAKDAN
jgi:hypothetical protein